MERQRERGRDGGGAGSADSSFYSAVPDGGYRADRLAGSVTGGGFQQSVMTPSSFLFLSSPLSSGASVLICPSCLLQTSFQLLLYIINGLQKKLRVILIMCSV